MVRNTRISTLYFLPADGTIEIVRRPAVVVLLGEVLRSCGAGLDERLAHRRLLALLGRQDGEVLALAGGELDHFGEERLGDQLPVGDEELLDVSGVLLRLADLAGPVGIRELAEHPDQDLVEGEELHLLLLVRVERVAPRPAQVGVGAGQLVERGGRELPAAQFFDRGGDPLFPPAGEPAGVLEGLPLRLDRRDVRVDLGAEGAEEFVALLLGAVAAVAHVDVEQRQSDAALPRVHVPAVAPDDVGAAGGEQGLLKFRVVLAHFILLWGGRA